MSIAAFDQTQHPRATNGQFAPKSNPDPGQSVVPDQSDKYAARWLADDDVFRFCHNGPGGIVEHYRDYKGVVHELPKIELVEQAMASGLASDDLKDKIAAMAPGVSRRITDKHAEALATAALMAWCLSKDDFADDLASNKYAKFHLVDLGPYADPHEWGAYDLEGWREEMYGEWNDRVYALAALTSKLADTYPTSTQDVIAAPSHVGRA